MEGTQEIKNNFNEIENTTPVQVGLLGIWGEQYPVYMGQNKIGRDPKTCNVVVNLNTISKQHVVLNILSKDSITLMDLKSSNKTMILNKVLKPFIPHSIKNGDTFQLGDALAILQLSEDNDDDIPMTQVIDNFDTPVPKRNLPRGHAAMTIPESPEKDESLVLPTRPKNSFNVDTSNEMFIKPSNYKVSKELDNGTLNNNDIHDIDTQMPYPIVKGNANSIYTNETQIAKEDISPQSIHFIATQIVPTDHLPGVCEFPIQHEVELNLYTRNNNIHEASTQIVTDCEIETELLNKDSVSTHCNINDKASAVNHSNEEILFNEFDSQPFEDDFESQTLLPQGIRSPIIGNPEKIKCNSYIQETVTSNKRNERISSSNSTDTEDIEIVLSQKIVENNIGEDDETDCEDILKESDEIKTKAGCSTINKQTNVIPDISNTIESGQHEIFFEDMPTQILPVENEEVGSNVITNCYLPDNSVGIENSQQFSEEIISPFKIPLQSLIKRKRQNQNKWVSKPSLALKPDVNDDKYYASTQDVQDDLCSQKSIASETESNHSNKKSSIEVSTCSNSKHDSSQSTSKKPSTLMDIDLPNSQEINNYVNETSKNTFINLLSESEPETSSEGPCTPNLNTKLSNKLDKLPTRFTTRKRKPTTKLKENNKILLSNFLIDQENDIDSEIIKENISRLKSKYNKNQNFRETDVDKKSCINKTQESLKSLNKKENGDRHKISKTLQKKENKLKSPETEKNITEIKKLNSVNKPRQYSRKLKINKATSDKTNEHLNNDENKKEIKTNKHNKTDLTTNDNNTGNETILHSHTSSRNLRKIKNKVDVEQKPILNPVKENVNTRRSKRQKNIEDKNEEPKPSVSHAVKHIRDDVSEVYHLTSSSSPESTNGLKRLAAENEIAPSAKRTRSTNKTNVRLRNTSKRSTRIHKVLFTAFPHDDVRSKLEGLGAVVVTDLTECTVVLTSKIKRTLKLLCAVGRGLPIVGNDWVQACVDTEMIVDPWRHILKDEDQEKRLNFNLARTLKGKRNFLNGYNVSSTPAVNPKASEMKLIVECSGGCWKEGGSRWVCVSSYADKALWPDLKEKGATIVTVEFILTGVLTQKIDMKTYKFRDDIGD